MSKDLTKAQQEQVNKYFKGEVDKIMLPEEEKKPITWADIDPRTLATMLLATGVVSASISLGILCGTENNGAIVWTIIFLTGIYGLIGSLISVGLFDRASKGRRL